MGERKKRTLRLDFNRRLKVEFHGAKVATDGGLLLYRELDVVLGGTGGMAGEVRLNIRESARNWQKRC